MIITCPACQGRYEADAAAFGPDRRRVRCASCGHAWEFYPESSELELTQPASHESADKETESGKLELSRTQIERRRRQALNRITQAAAPHERIRQQQRERQKNQLRYVSWIPWVVACVLFTGFAGLFFGARDSIVKSWPESASIFRTFGQDVNRYGLELRGLEVKRSYEGIDAVMSVTGEVVNVTSSRQAATPVRIALQDKKGKEIQVWFAELEMSEMAPGASSPFALKIEAPPTHAVNLQAAFADKPDAGDGSQAHDSHDDGHDKDQEASVAASGHDDGHSPAAKTEHHDAPH